MEMKNKKKRILIILIVCIILFVFYWCENKYLVVSNYSYTSEKLSIDSNGFRIVQISDLHNTSFGFHNKRLQKLIEIQNPNIIVITGDLVDSTFTNINRALQFAEDAVKICPVYYVTGNHEYWLGDEKYQELISGLKEKGVIVLQNEVVSITDGNTSFYLVGLDDRNLTDDTLAGLLKGTESELSIVLAHEPQYFSQYATAKPDLVLSGHAHGGQFILPFIGPVIAPDQGFWPEYTEGLFTKDSTTMIISRGLGNSVIPFRLFNNPELVVVELKSSK